VIASSVEHDGGASRRPLRRDRDLRRDDVDEVDPPALQVPRRLLGRRRILDPPDVQRELLAFLEAQLSEALPHAVRHRMVVAVDVDDPDSLDATGRLAWSIVRLGDEPEDGERGEHPACDRHAAAARWWLSTPGIFRQPSRFRNPSPARRGGREARHERLSRARRSGSIGCAGRLRPRL
jgi:hypothetical protein